MGDSGASRSERRTSVNPFWRSPATTWGRASDVSGAVLPPVMCMTMIEPGRALLITLRTIAGTEVPNASPLGRSYWTTVTPVGAMARNAASSKQPPGNRSRGWGGP